MESELVYKREKARENKDFVLSDKIRDELDSKGVIIFDTKDGQEVYYTINSTRQDVVDKINRHKRAEAMFNAWLFSMKN
jgi:hypothetical protein